MSAARLLDILKIFNNYEKHNNLYKKIRQEKTPKLMGALLLMFSSNRRRNHIRLLVQNFSYECMFNYYW